MRKARKRAFLFSEGVTGSVLSLLPAQEGWEEVADYALEWALANATRPAATPARSRVTRPIEAGRVDYLRARAATGSTAAFPKR